MRPLPRFRHRARPAAGAPALADSNPSIAGKPDAEEAAFVRSIQADLGQRFPTAVSAERAGYLRYTNEDDTGSISYGEPSVAVARRASPEPALVRRARSAARRRLLRFEDQRDAAAPVGNSTGPLERIRRARALRRDRSRDRRASIRQVTSCRRHSSKRAAIFERRPAATLVKLGLVKRTRDVSTIFLFPTIWDLIVWVKPNPSGAFADKNPLVSPIDALTVAGKRNAATRSTNAVVRGRIASRSTKRFPPMSSIVSGP